MGKIINDTRHKTLQEQLQIESRNQVKLSNLPLIEKVLTSWHQWINVQVFASDADEGKTSGLCGNDDGNPNNDCNGGNNCNRNNNFFHSQRVKVVLK